MNRSERSENGKKRLRRALVMPCVAVLVVVPWTLHSLEREDREHARFYNAGKTINAFLKDYCTGLETARSEGSVEPLMELFSDNYRAPKRGHLRFDAATWQSAGIATRTLRSESSETLGHDDLAGELAAYLDTISELDKTICKIDLIEQIEPGESAQLTVKHIFDGLTADGEAFQDRIFYRWTLRDEGDAGAYRWRIVRDDLVEGIRVVGERHGLQSADLGRLGIDFAHRRDPNLHMEAYREELKFGVIQHASGGISAADFDRDGRPDLLFLDGVESKLYHNVGSVDGGGARFRDVTDEVGLDGLDRAHVGLFADFDNDGDRDLFVGRYLAPNRYFENVGESFPRFEERGESMGLAAIVPSTAATVLDFDKDGYLDLYLGLNGNAFEALPRLPFFARNGQPNRLYRNDGGRGFVDVTEASGTGDTGWALAVATGDVDGDGFPDLAVANDFGRKVLYLNRGDGTFSDIAKDAGVLDFSGGMGLAFGDFDDDGRVDLYTSNINSNQRWFGEDMTVRQYIRNVTRSRWAVLDAMEYVALYRLVGEDWVGLGQQIGEGNSLFRNLGTAADDGTPMFEEIHHSNASRAGWGWSVSFFDLDNDSDLDLYAANGWISSQPGTDL
ncbi:MAG: VCBS repeat-containing protein [Acidobacteriota bacterium]